MKEQGFVKDLLITKNLTEAARRNYNIGGKGGRTDEKSIINVASSIGVENTHKPRIRAILDKHGFTEDYLVSKLKDHVEEGENENAQVKSIEIGFKLHGHLMSGSQPIQPTINLYQQYNQLDDKSVKKKLDDLAQKLLNFKQQHEEKTKEEEQKEVK